MSTKKLIAQAMRCCDSTTTDGGMLLLSAEEKSELDRRLAEDEAAPNDVVDWESIKTEAQARWQNYAKNELGKTLNKF
jgi:putative addiction module component (TIGR02574 family)